MEPPYQGEQSIRLFATSAGNVQQQARQRAGAVRIVGPQLDEAGAASDDLEDVGEIMRHTRRELAQEFLALQFSTSIVG